METVLQSNDLLLIPPTCYTIETVEISDLTVYFTGLTTEIIWVIDS